jgi:hypothetical protein
MTPIDDGEVHFSPLDDEALAAGEADLHDAELFARAMQGVGQGPLGDFGDAERYPALSRLQAFVGAQAERREKLDKSFLQAARTGSPEQMYSIARAMTDTALTHHLAVKIVSKVQQGIDSLVRLQ